MTLSLTVTMDDSRPRAIVAGKYYRDLAFGPRCMAPVAQATHAKSAEFCRSRWMGAPNVGRVPNAAPDRFEAACTQGWRAHRVPHGLHSPDRASPRFCGRSDSGWRLG